MLDGAVDASFGGVIIMEHVLCSVSILISYSYVQQNVEANVNDIVECMGMCLKMLLDPKFCP